MLTFLTDYLGTPTIIVDRIIRGRNTRIVIWKNVDQWLIDNIHNQPHGNVTVHNNEIAYGYMA